MPAVTFTQQVGGRFDGAWRASWKGYSAWGDAKLHAAIRLVEAVSAMDTVDGQAARFAFGAIRANAVEGTRVTAEELAEAVLGGID